MSIDYHIEVDAHYYSVPFRHAGEQVDVRLSAATVEVFLSAQRIASHRRNPHRGRHTTLSEHMPESHRRHAEWSPRRIIAWAAKTGPSTQALVEHILAARPHPEQGYRSCLGILRLGNAYGAERLEAAARRGVAIGVTSYKSIASILKSGLDQQPLPEEPDHTRQATLYHENIRGAAYYGAPRSTDTEPC